MSLYDHPLTAASVVADSISPLGVRVTTLEVTMHRFVLAEFNTHRVFSRSSASSRAIPITKTLDSLNHTGPAFPVEWPSEIRGMQGGAPLVGQDLDEAVALLERISDHARDEIRAYVASHPDVRLHKSILNRPLEWFGWHKLLVTSTEWINFFKQRSSRYSPLAQPEIRLAADLMLEALDASRPQKVEWGDWHMPYITAEDHNEHNLETLQQISVARCARVSGLNHGGVRDVQEDLAFFNRLMDADPRHVAPLEMVCTPAMQSSIDRHEVQGNFYGWHQLRHQFQG